MLSEVNDYITGRKKIEDTDDDEPKGGQGGGTDATGEIIQNKGTLIEDATCVPADIRFPTDISLLNEFREKLENMILQLHK